MIAELIAHTDQVLSLAKDGSVVFLGSSASFVAREIGERHAPTRLHELDDESPKHRVDHSQLSDDPGLNAIALAREDAKRKSGDWTVYWYYAKASGVVRTVVFLFGAALTATAWQIGVLWIKKWSEDTLLGHAHNVSYYIGIYGVITAVAGVGLASTAAGSMVFMVSKGSGNFHAALLQSVARAPVSYFAAADVGITLNRFIQDLR